MPVKVSCSPEALRCSKNGQKRYCVTQPFRDFCADSLRPSDSGSTAPGPLVLAGWVQARSLNREVHPEHKHRTFSFRRLLDPLYRGILAGRTLTAANVLLLLDGEGCHLPMVERAMEVSSGVVFLRYYFVHPVPEVLSGARLTSLARQLCSCFLGN